MSNRATINPSGNAQLFAPMLKPLSQLEFGKGAGVAGSAREVARAEAAKQGYQDGYQQGFEVAQADAWKQFEAAHREAILAFVEELNERADRLDATFRDWVGQLDRPLAGLAAVIAARVVGAEIKSHPDTILTIAKQALAEVTHATDARVRINPFDSEVMEAHRDSLLAASGGLRRIEIVADPTIAGGCVVETEGGTIDARVESMLERALRGLRGDQ